MRTDPRRERDEASLGTSDTRVGLEALISQVKALRETVQDMTKEVAVADSGES